MTGPDCSPRNAHSITPSVFLLLFRGGPQGPQPVEATTAHNGPVRRANTPLKSGTRRGSTAPRAARICICSDGDATTRRRRVPTARGFRKCRPSSSCPAPLFPFIPAPRRCHGHVPPTVPEPESKLRIRTSLSLVGREGCRSWHGEAVDAGLTRCTGAAVVGASCSRLASPTSGSARPIGAGQPSDAESLLVVGCTRRRTGAAVQRGARPGT